MTSELTSPCSCATDFTAHTQTVTHTQLWGKRTVCSCRFIQYYPTFSRGLFLTPLLSHSGVMEGNVVDHVGMLLADRPSGGKMSDGRMFWPRRVVTQKRKHDGSAQGERGSKGNSQFWFHSQSIAAFSLPNDALSLNAKKKKKKKTYQIEHQHEFAGFPYKESKGEKNKPRVCPHNVFFIFFLIRSH